MTTSDPNGAGRPVSLFSRILREPLLHFLLIGALVFAVYGQRPQIPTTSTGTIEVTQAQVERLAAQFQAVWRRAPDAQELEGLVEGFVREEVYYREALALGLDRDDTVIRRRLHLKMEFITEAAAEAMSPDDATLQDFLDARPDRFASPERITFRQIFLGDSDLDATLAELKAGADPASLGRGGLLPGTMEAAVESVVDGTFGTDFFSRVSVLDPGDWRGPVVSSYGPHLVRLDSLEPAALPRLDQIREQVEAEWRQNEAERLRETGYQTLRARYEVITPETETTR